MSDRLCRTVQVVVAFLFIFCQRSTAQSSYGSVVGTVTDSIKATIVDASVTLTNLGTAERRKAASDANGNFEFVNLQPRTHLTRNAVRVVVEVLTRVDAMMQVCAVDQKVEVTAKAPLLQTENATAGQILEGRADHARNRGIPL